jgi:hypothetical protein
MADEMDADVNSVINAQLYGFTPLSALQSVPSFTASNITIGEHKDQSISTHPTSPFFTVSEFIELLDALEVPFLMRADDWILTMVVGQVGFAEIKSITIPNKESTPFPNKSLTASLFRNVRTFLRYIREFRISPVIPIPGINLGSRFLKQISTPTRTLESPVPHWQASYRTGKHGTALVNTGATLRIPVPHHTQEFP